MHKILVIDDDINMLTVVQMTLSMNGFIVETLHKWQHTFDKIDAFDPDLILLDISLGGEDGRNISKQIKSNESTKHIHIILFSVFYTLDKALAGSMADDFIAKPFEASELLDKINLGISKINNFAY